VLWVLGFLEEMRVQKSLACLGQSVARHRGQGLFGPSPKATAPQGSQSNF